MVRPQRANFLLRPVVGGGAGEVGVGYVEIVNGVVEGEGFGADGFAGE